jgi:ABC-type multidrug transport system ATPase subunit
LKQRLTDANSDTYLANEDDDVKKEREFVYKDDLHPENLPLIVQDVKKVYPAKDGAKEKHALKSFCLSIRRGEMFGLLGPNGAGKTTLISILTGLYEADEGKAVVNGVNILENPAQIHMNMGVCPQFDLQWVNLTVREHLTFYALVKGVEPSRVKESVELAIKEVYLTKAADKYSRELSGGMRRRLSVAISMVGDPSIVLLDEPTTGLDPENRRQLWDILVGKES